MAKTQKEISKEWYERNKDKIKERRKGTRREERLKYYAKNKETLKEKAKLYRERPEIKEKLRQNLVNWRLKNPEKSLHTKARQRAKALGLEFNIEVSDIVIPPTCPLLSIPIKKEIGAIDTAPSLDRIDNTKGYIKGNVWIISFKANRMKNTASIEELKQFAINCLKHFNTSKDISNG